MLICHTADICGGLMAMPEEQL